MKTQTHILVHSMSHVCSGCHVIRVYMWWDDEWVLLPGASAPMDDNHNPTIAGYLGLTYLEILKWNLEERWS